MLIAQISDMHISARGAPSMGGIDTVGNLERCVAAIESLRPRPDLILATGDLVKDGAAEEYSTLNEILAPLTRPVFAIPGNHDLRENMLNGLGDAGYLPRDAEHLHFTLEDYPLRIVALDTVVPEAPHGALEDGRLDWLAARLAEAPNRPTVIVMHHPPFRTGFRMMDGMRCSGGEALGALVRQHDQIERILCGHLHRAAHVRFHTTTATVAPSTAAQLELDLTRVRDPERGAVWSDDPPAFMLHLWDDDARLVSHTVQVGP